MDALMAALVAATLAQVGDRTAWLAAILADRYRAPVTIVLMAALALLGAGLLAAFAGSLLAPKLTPEAKQLFLALALVFQGVGAFWPIRSPERLDGWRIGAAATSLAALFILAFGDGIQFIVLALAAGAAIPWLAAVGATLGSLAIVVPAVAMGETAWTRLPLVVARRSIGGLFLIVGLFLGLGAVSLI